MPSENRQNLCVYHMGLTDDPEECRTGCGESEASKRMAAGIARLAPHLDLAARIATKALAAPAAEGGRE